MWKIPALRRRSRYISFRPPALLSSQKKYDRRTMSDQKDGREGHGAVRAKGSRQDRLKLALRENLKRRKSQARERDKMTAEPSQDDEAVLHQEAVKKPGK
jgi:hypothetical protein